LSNTVTAIRINPTNLHQWPRAVLARQFSIIFATLVLALTYVRSNSAEVSDIEVQGPWAYKHQFDEAHRIEFLATTRAKNPEMFLVLGCSTARTVMSFIYLDHFPYSLPERGHVTVQFDQSDPIWLSTALVEGQSLLADPRTTRDLISMLKRSSRLSLSVTEASGTVDTYVFSLQPNDLALQHCD
jgi:hypothetical protein